MPSCGLRDRPQPKSLPTVLGAIEQDLRLRYPSGLVRPLGPAVFNTTREVLSSRLSVRLHGVEQAPVFPFVQTACDVGTELLSARLLEFAWKGMGTEAHCRTLPSRNVLVQSDFLNCGRPALHNYTSTMGTPGLASTSYVHSSCQAKMKC